MLSCMARAVISVIACYMQCNARAKRGLYVWLDQTIDIQPVSINFDPTRRNMILGTGETLAQLSVMHAYSEDAISPG